MEDPFSDRPSPNQPYDIPQWAIDYAQRFHAGPDRSMPPPTPAMPAELQAFNGRGNGYNDYYAQQQYMQQDAYQRSLTQGYDRQQYDGRWQQGQQGQQGEYFVRVYPNGNPYEQGYSQGYDTYSRQYYQQGQDMWRGQEYRQRPGCGCVPNQRNYYDGYNNGYYDQRQQYDQRGYYDQRQQYDQRGYYDRGRGQEYMIEPKYQYWQPDYDAQNRIQQRYREQYSYRQEEQNYDRRPTNRGNNGGNWRNNQSNNPYWQRMSHTISSMEGASIKQYDPRVPEDLGCAAFVSAALKRTYGIPFTDTSVASLEKNLKRQGFVAVPVSQAEPGDVIIGHRSPGRHGHAAIYVGDGQIANNSSAKRRIVVDNASKFNNGEFRQITAYRRMA